MLPGALSQQTETGGHCASELGQRCTCGFPCISKTSKSLLNYDRQYWTCGSTESTCGFFVWQPSEAEIPSQQSDIAVPATGGSAAGSQSGGDLLNGSQDGPMCHCQLPVKRTTIKAGPNIGREKLACPNGEDGCGYHAIADELMLTQHLAETSQPLSTPSQPTQHQPNITYPVTPSTQPPAGNSFFPDGQATRSPAGGRRPMGLQTPTQNAGSFVNQPADSFRQWLPASQASSQPQGLSQSFSQGSQASGGTSQASGGFGTPGVSSQGMHQAMDFAIENTLQPFTGGSQNFNTPPTAAAAQPEKMCRCNPPQVCVVRRSKQERSLGKEFFACPKPQGQQCKGWQGWVEDFQPSSQQGVHQQAFTNIASPPPSQGRNNMRCFKCNQYGHWARDCPNA